MQCRDHEVTLTEALLSRLRSRVDRSTRERLETILEGINVGPVARTQHPIVLVLLAVVLVPLLPEIVELALLKAIDVPLRRLCGDASSRVEPLPAGSQEGSPRGRQQDVEFEQRLASAGIATALGALGITGFGLMQLLRRLLSVVFPSQDRQTNST